MARAATTTDVFNAIAEAKRREMIGLLNNGKYWTVSEIVGRMKITQPTASKHLRVLRKVGIVTVVKHGRYRQYRVNAQSLRPLLDWARIFHQQGARERSAGTKRKQVIEGFGVVPLGVNRLHRV